jgi:hypothetical protein
VPAITGRKPRPREATARAAGSSPLSLQGQGQTRPRAKSMGWLVGMVLDILASGAGRWAKLPAGGHDLGYAAGQAKAGALYAHQLATGNGVTTLALGIHGGGGMRPQVTEGPGSRAQVDNHAANIGDLGNWVQSATQRAGKDLQGEQGQVRGESLPGKPKGGGQIAGAKVHGIVMGVGLAAQIAGADVEQGAKDTAAQAHDDLMQGMLEFKRLYHLESNR